MGCVFERKKEKKQARRELAVFLSGCASMAGTLYKRQPGLVLLLGFRGRGAAGETRQSRLIPQGFTWPAENILELSKEINCLAGYKVLNVLRDETQILCVFLTVLECRVPAWRWGRGGGAGSSGAL